MASVVAAVMFAGVGLVGCGGAEFEDRTAEVSLGETSISFDLVSCGLDGSTVFLVGRGGGASILQVVMELDDDASKSIRHAEEELTRRLLARYESAMEARRSGPTEGIDYELIQRVAE